MKPKETALEYLEDMVSEVSDTRKKPWLKPAIRSHLALKGYSYGEISEAFDKFFEEEDLPCLNSRSNS